MFDRIRTLVSGITPASDVGVASTGRRLARLPRAGLRWLGSLAGRGGRATPADAPASAPAEPASAVEPSATFCAHAWTYAFVNSFGQVQPCCEFGFPITEGDSALTLREHALAEIWGSDPMRRMRREMVEGKTVRGCESCYVREAVGAQSMRQTCNAVVGPERIRRFIEQSVASDFQVAPMPEVVEVVVGNRCNLKCRMCRSSSSSLIAKDRVHVRWNYQEYLPVEAEAVLALLDERLFRDPAHLRRVHFIGGEPFVINEIEKTLQLLIDRGVAGRITLSMNTNGTRVSPRWMKLTESFEKLHLSISIDGVGDTFEYIRFPARWSDLERNLDVFRAMPHVELDANVTVQNYNVLGITELFRYLDRAGLTGWRARTVQDVPRLRVTTMPPAARRLAAERLRAYVDGDCRPENRETVGCIVEELESAGDGLDAELLREFMLFTNDLDRSRRQSFARACPELFALIEASGFVWSDEILYASADAGAAAAVETA